ncbi:ABC transporter permease subunit [Candidatus Haliotispira prima]|uniref:ABC transporter permease subunit n=1 Tax=Candidatus Haliotispira prima TaxID=3034016 RepID=A0ABY8MF97_9SPIO|nr:ABC transporter permease subunit [Candidatus Haliotispira prima]
MQKIYPHKIVPVLRTCSLVLVLLVGTLYLAPFILLGSGAWEADSDVLRTLFTSVLGSYLVNTLLLCGGVLLGSLAIGVSTAWLVTQYEFPLRRVFTLLLPISIIISPYMRGLVFMEYANNLQFAAYPVLQKYVPDLLPVLNQWWNFPFLVLTLTLSLFPYVYVFTATMYNRNSRSIIDTARLLNHSHRSLFFSVGLPVAGPALRIGAAVVLMDTLNEYGAISYFGFPTISSAVFRTWFVYKDIGSAKLLAGIVLLLVLLLVTAFRKKDEGMRYDINRHYPVHREKLPLAKGLPASLFCTFWIFLGFVLPVSQFIQWAQVSTGSLSRLWDMTKDTLYFVAVTACIGIGLAVFLSYMHHLRQNKIYKTIFHYMTLGYAIPSTVAAIAVLGLIYFLVGLFDSPGISQLLAGKTIVGLVFAAILRFFFVIAKPVYQGFHHYGRRYEDASSSLGASGPGTFFRIALPLNAPFIFSGALLFLIELLKEIPLTLILRPFNFNTLAINAYLLARDEMLMASSIPTLVIIVIGLIGTLLFQWIEHRWKPA